MVALVFIRLKRKRLQTANEVQVQLYYPGPIHGLFTLFNIVFMVSYLFGT